MVPSLSKAVVSLSAVAALAIILAGCASVGGDASSATSTSTPITVDGVRYIRVTDTMFGFSLNIPTGLQTLAVQHYSGESGEGDEWMAPDSNAANWLDIKAGGLVSGLQPNQCPQAIPGTIQVQVGPGITGYELDETTEPSTIVPGAGPYIPHQSVDFLWRGVDITIELAGKPPYATYTQRYGAIWHEMLTSFTPGSYINPHPVCEG